MLDHQHVQVTPKIEGFLIPEPYKAVVGGGIPLHTPYIGVGCGG